MGIKIFGSRPQAQPERTQPEMEWPGSSPVATVTIPDSTAAEPSAPNLLDMESLIEPGLDSPDSEGEGSPDGIAEDAPAEAATPVPHGENDFDDGLLDIFTDDEEVDEARLRLARSLEDVSIDSLLAYTRSIIVLLRNTK